MKNYTLNGVNVTIVLKSKHHRWMIFFNEPSEKPDLELTMAKGEAVIKFLDELERVQGDKNNDKNK